MRRSGVGRRVLSALVATWIGAQALAPSVAAASVALVVQDDRITAPVGFALDSADYVFWTANSTDSKVVAYAVDYSGVTQARLTLDAQAEGIGGIAFHDRRLYIADFGTPNVAQRGVSVFWVQGPRLSTAAVSYNAWDFTFPDNSYLPAALLVSPTGRLLIVCRGAAGAIYEAPAKPVAGGANQLVRVASAPRDVTSGTFLADGRIALRTSKGVVVLDPKTYQVVAQGPVAEADGGPLLSPSASGTQLLLADKGAKATLRTHKIPDSIVDLEPEPTPTPTPVAAGAPEPEAPGTTFDRNGTLLAIGAAAALAFAAGAVVMVRR